MTTALSRVPLLARVAANVADMRAHAAAARQRIAPPPRPRPAVVAGLVVLIAAIVVAVGFAFDGWAVPAARALPAGLRQFFRVVSDLGQSKWELFPAGILGLVLLFGNWRVVAPRIRDAWAEIGALSAYIFLSIAGAGILVNIVKQPIGRGRPTTFDEWGPLVFHPLRFQYAFQSFPSGHSTTGGALIAIGFLVFPRLRWPIALFGVLIGISRIAVEAHYPSDVVAGLAVGYFFSIWLAGRFAAAGWAFSRGPGGAMTAQTSAWRHMTVTFGGVRALFSGLVDALAGRPTDRRA